MNIAQRLWVRHRLPFSCHWAQWPTGISVCWLLYLHCYLCAVCMSELRVEFHVSFLWQGDLGRPGFPGSDGLPGSFVSMSAIYETIIARWPVSPWMPTIWPKLDTFCLFPTSRLTTKQMGILQSSVFVRYMSHRKWPIPVKLAAQTVFFSGHYPISTKAETPYCQCNAADRPPLIPPTFHLYYTRHSTCMHLWPPCHTFEVWSAGWFHRLDHV